MTRQILMMRSMIACFAMLFLWSSIHAQAQDILTNPVVVDAQFGEFQHGSYPSFGSRTHVGSDLRAACGAKVRAFADGEVVDVITDTDDPNFNTLGYMVILKHEKSLMGQEFYTSYFHLNAPPSVNRGVEVHGGKTPIGEAGNTGVAYDCQVHFEIRTFPERFNPAWENLYGEGDQRDADALFADWEDPQDYFLIYPKGLVHLTGKDIEMEEAVDLIPEDKELVFTIVEEMPQLIGGLNAVQKHVAYPEEAEVRKIQGRVFVELIVNKEGDVADARVVRGLGYGCDEVAVAAVKEAKFKPGKQAGEPVSVKMSLPVSFKL